MIEKQKKPEVPELLKIPYVIGALIVAVLSPIVFAAGCLGYLLAEEYIWETP
jgi:hypothetical protein